jgi:glycosyltransferase involved in cell wall biosynthesis
MDLDSQAAVVPALPVPLVCIGMPVRNGEAFLAAALDSLLGQTFGDFELIICDNASTDRTEELCRQYAEADTRVRYVRNDHNIGLQANFDKVLALATAPYFMWASHDDVWDRTYIARMVEQLDLNPRLVMAGSNSASIDERGEVRRLYDLGPVYAPESTYARARRLLCAPPRGAHATMIYALMRTPVLREIGLVQSGEIREYDRGVFGSDKLTVFELLFRGDFYVAPETLYFHRDVVGPARGIATGRQTPRPRGFRIRRIVAQSIDVHGYFAALRRIIRRVDLGRREKVALLVVAVIQELKFYPSNVIAVAVRRPR